jgi:hypothetical protein
VGAREGGDGGKRRWIAEGEGEPWKSGRATTRAGEEGESTKVSKRRLNERREVGVVNEWSRAGDLGKLVAIRALLSSPSQLFSRSSCRTVSLITRLALFPSFLTSLFTQGMPGSVFTSIYSLYTPG